MPYAVIAYPMVFVFLVRLWSVSHRHGFVTLAGFVRARSGSGLRLVSWDATARTQQHAYLPGIAAPRGALSYPQLSWEELGGTFLGLMPYPAPNGYGNSSMMRHDALCHIPCSAGRNLEGRSWV